MNHHDRNFWKIARPHLLLVLTTMIWASNVIAGKFAIGHISPMVLTFSRWLIAFVLVSIIAHKHIRADWPMIRRNFIYLLVMGTVGYTGFNVLLYSALHHTTAINVAIEQSAMPLMIFIASLAIYRLPFGWAQIIGFILTIFGVALVISGGDLSNLTISTLNRGDIMMFVAAIFYSGYSVALKNKPDMHWMSLLVIMFAGALIAAFISLLWEINAGNALYPTTVTGFAVIIYTGLFASIVAQASFIEGVGKLGANAAGIYINLLPVFAAIFAVLLLGETLGIHHAAALVLVIVGISLVQRKPRG